MHSKILVGIKFHRRDIEPGNSIGIRGLVPHHDYDADDIIMIKVRQHNMLGGENQTILNNSEEVLTNDNIPAEGSAVLMMNNEIRHKVGNMYLANKSEYGYRDVIILEVNPLLCPRHNPIETNLNFI